MNTQEGYASQLHKQPGSSRSRLFIERIDKIDAIQVQETLNFLKEKLSSKISAKNLKIESLYIGQFIVIKISKIDPNLVLFNKKLLVMDLYNDFVDFCIKSEKLKKSEISVMLAYKKILKVFTDTFLAFSFAQDKALYLSELCRKELSAIVEKHQISRETMTELSQAYYNSNRLAQMHPNRQVKDLIKNEGDYFYFLLQHALEVESDHAEVGQLKGEICYQLQCLDRVNLICQHFQTRKLEQTDSESSSLLKYSYFSIQKGLEEVVSVLDSKFQSKSFCLLFLLILPLLE